MPWGILYLEGFFFISFFVYFLVFSSLFCINFKGNFLLVTFYEILENVHEVKWVVLMWCLDVHSLIVFEVNKAMLTQNHVTSWLY